MYRIYCCYSHSYCRCSILFNFHALLVCFYTYVTNALTMTVSISTLLVQFCGHVYWCVCVCRSRSQYSGKYISSKIHKMAALVVALNEQYMLHCIDWCPQRVAFNIHFVDVRTACSWVGREGRRAFRCTMPIANRPLKHMSYNLLWTYSQVSKSL